AHPSSPCGCDTSTLIALPRTACRPAAPRDQAPGHTPLAAGEPARSPFFCGPFLPHLNLEIALRHELLQSRILRLELPQALDVVRLQSTETLAPSIDRLLADAVPRGLRCHRIAIPLPDDRDHLLFRKTSFSHCSLRIGSQSLNLSMVRKSGGRSTATRQKDETNAYQEFLQSTRALMAKRFREQHKSFDCQNPEKNAN